MLLAAIMVIKLFMLQILQHDYYTAFATGTHEFYQKLYPRRGQIFFRDSRTGEQYPAAINRQYFNIYAVPKEIPAEEVRTIADKLALFLQYDDEKKQLLIQKLSKQDDPYEAIDKKITDEIMEAINNEKLTGIYGVRQEYRYYPENELSSAVLGFLGQDVDGNPVGHYGVEGYWNSVLSGKSGFLQGARAAKGGWISSAGLVSEEVKNGADIVLTIDRAIENRACARLVEGWKEYGAKSAALVMLEAKTGAVLAMCSYPDFDPNSYSKVEDLSVYNNTTIFTAYEPGSVFKPITMAAAVDSGVVDPDTTFVDPCKREIEDFTIRNALDKCYGTPTMTQVLENSINTGMIWVEERMKGDDFSSYVKKFGFGENTGITLETEEPGNVSSLDKKGKIYKAVGSFGQGLTATPIQLATAYTAFTNNGQVVKPYVVEEVKYENGVTEKTEPQVVEQVISPRAAKLITGMLVSVAENTYGSKLNIKDYYVAGKTGTAQIPGKGGYTEETNHTFVGYAPANDPKFILVVKYEAPQREWAESTALPVFRDVAEFALKYYGVRGDK